MNTGKSIFSAICLVVFLTGCYPEIVSVTPDPAVPITMNPGDSLVFEVTHDMGNYTDTVRPLVSWTIIDESSAGSTTTPDNTTRIVEDRELINPSTAIFFPDTRRAGKYKIGYTCKYVLLTTNIFNPFVTLKSESLSWNVEVKGITVLPETSILANGQQQYTAMVYPEGTYTYQWFLDGEPVSAAQTYSFSPSRDQVGMHTLRVNTTGEGGTYNHSRQVVVPFASVGAGLNRPRSIEKTTDGGYIVAGDSYQTDIPDAPNHGPENTSDVSVLKFDVLGNLTWRKLLGGSGHEGAARIHQTKDGGFILIGHSDSRDIPDAPHMGGDDAYVVKLDSLGTVVWQKLLGGTYNDRLASIQPTTDDGYIMVGYSGLNYAPDSNPDCWALKLDSLGNVQWENRYGGSGSDYGDQIFADPSGGYLIAGWSSSPEILGASAIDEKNDYLVKITHEGATLWQKRFGDGRDRYNSASATSWDGGYLSAYLLGNAANLRDIRINKFGDEGEQIFQNTLTCGMKKMNAVVANPEGGFLLTGSSYSLNLAQTIVLDSLGKQAVVETYGEKEKTTTYSELMDAVYIGDNRYMGILTTDTCSYLILIGADGN